MKASLRWLYTAVGTLAWMDIFQIVFVVMVVSVVAFLFGSPENIFLVHSSGFKFCQEDILTNICREELASGIFQDFEKIYVLLLASAQS